jgi:hypothetical protein
MSNQVNIKGVEVSTDHYIDGKRVSSEKKFSVILAKFLLKYQGVMMG